MYWPIGAPKVYALSKHASSRTSALYSHDGLRSTSLGSESSDGDNKSGEQHSTTHANNDRGATTAALKQDEKGNRNGQDNGIGESIILSAKVSRGGAVFATITRSSLTIWQTKPTVALASVVRSAQSMKAYGPNAALIFRPDSLLVVAQTTQGYLIAYSLATDPNARVYHTEVPSSSRNARKDSVEGYSSYRKQNAVPVDLGPAEGDGIREVNIRFRMVIRIDAGISKSVALDDELIVATQKPAALQCIRWPATSESAKVGSAQTTTSTELLSKMTWIADNCNVVEMVHDRPMNLTCWITNDGRAYVVQRRSPSNVDMDNPASLFQGFCFRESDPLREDTGAVKAAINARFSLIAIACSNGEIDVYLVKNYFGNIPFSHKMQPPASLTVSGNVTFLSYSPDGYCLLAGYEKGWAMWSVYGKIIANTFSGQDRTQTELNDEQWLQGIKDAFWIGGGSELFLLGNNDDRLWSLEIARSAITGCFSPANVYRGVLFSSNSVKIYSGHNLPDLTALPSDMSLWQNIQIPSSYLLHHWPIKTVVISSDGYYLAVAGRRGFAHYSTISSRWRSFDDLAVEHEVSIRGGMCWYQHFLIVCVETTEGKKNQIRMYDRSKPLTNSHIVHTEELSAPAVFAAISGTDSLLVYTHDNTLLHFIILPDSTSIKLVQVGQIGFHGIIRAPARVRAISWILPEDQIEHGDPSQDVATASVLFLVDGKLVLLQPSTNEQGELKYDMRVIAQNVEYYCLLRDQNIALPTSKTSVEVAASGDMNGLPFDNALGHSLRDSLWYFDGMTFHAWSDIQDVLACAPAELGRDLPPTVRIPVDFYPMSPLVAKGIINGLDVDLVQRRDIDFSFLRLTPRTTLFLPPLLRHHLAEYNSPAALHLSHSYQHLPYFSHALEVLLHDVLDAEVDNPPSPPETALLPGAIAFLSSFQSYLDIVVNCTRKTELRSWRTLFSHLPPVLDLFEQSLAQGKLKTAAGYLLVLHTFEERQDEGGFQVHEFARLLRRAVAAQDWELCKELARFLVGIDESGKILETALQAAGLGIGNARAGSVGSIALNGSASPEPDRESRERSDTLRNGMSGTSGSVDYFSLERASDGEEEAYSTPEGV